MLKPIEIALAEWGQHDILGKQSNSRILQYFTKTGNSWVTDNDTSWCAAYVGYCLDMAGIKSTDKLNARSYLNWGLAIQNPQVGDIVVLWRISPQSAYGHVGFFIKKDANSVWILGGNQNDQVCIESFPLSRVLGYRSYPHN